MRLFAIVATLALVLVARPGQTAGPGPLTAQALAGQISVASLRGQFVQPTISVR